MSDKRTNKADEKHLRFAVLATDVALFTLRDGRLYVRMTAVRRPPHFPNHKGLPGGLVRPEETAEEAVIRHINDKALIDPSRCYIEQLYTFSAINRDPRGRVVAVAYLALTPWTDLTEDERADTEDAWWSPLSAAKGLAYDHDGIASVASKRLRSRVSYTTLLSKVMPSEFTLTELEDAYSTILGAELDKRNFRKKILKLDILSELPHKRTGGRSRPARLYRFNSNKIKEAAIV